MIQKVNDFTDIRNIRVFISSTFIDMHGERDELVKRVFPQLRSICEQRGVGWSEVDLRWGVTDEEKAEGKVLPVCLAEINNCRPYFIGMLGERYGWISEKISQDILDLAPWLADEQDLSITEIEMRYGVLNSPIDTGKSFFYFRDPHYSDTFPVELKQNYNESSNSKNFLTDKDLTIRRKKLTDLKEKIRNSGVHLIENYASPKELGDLILNDFKKVIDELYPANRALNKYEKENLEQKTFINNRTSVYIETQNNFKLFSEHIESENKNLAVTGEAGAGKSALLSNWIRQFTNENNLIFYHFTGSSSDSTDWQFMLRRFIYNFNKKMTDEEQIEIPESAGELISSFNSALESLSKENKVIIIIDAVNQLDDKNGAKNLVWLSENLHKNIKFIISTIDDAPLDEAKRRGWDTLNISQLNTEEKNEFIKEYLYDKYGKHLSSGHISKIISSGLSSNPLSLTLLLEELRVYGNPLTLSHYIEHYVSAENSEELIRKIISRYEQDFESEYPGLVKKALSLLWLSKEGLRESELQELLSKSEGKILPGAVWSPFYLAIEKLLIKKSGGLLAIFHNTLRDVIENIYLQNETERGNNRKNILECFEGKPISERKISELIYQLIQLKKWEELSNELSNLSVFWSLYFSNKFELHNYWNLVERKTNISCKKIYFNLLEEINEFSVNEENEYLIADCAEFLSKRKMYEEAIELYKLIAKYYQTKLLQDMDAVNDYLKILQKIEDILIVMGEAEKALFLNQTELQISLAPGKYFSEFMSFQLPRIIKEGIPEKERKSVFRKLLLKSYTKQTVIFDKLIKPDIIALAVSRNGEILYALEQYKEALNTFNIVTKLLYNKIYYTSNFIEFAVKLAFKLTTPIMYIYSLKEKDSKKAKQIRKLPEFFLKNIIKRADSYIPLLARAYENQAKVLHKFEKNKEALSYYAKAEKLYIEVIDKYNLCNNLEGQLNIYISLKNINSAILLNQRLEKICREINNLEILYRTLKNRIEIENNCDEKSVLKEINQLEKILGKEAVAEVNDYKYNGTLPFTSRRMEILMNIKIAKEYLDKKEYDLFLNSITKTQQKCHDAEKTENSKYINKKINKAINRRTVNYDWSFYLIFGLLFTVLLFTKTIADSWFNLSPDIQDMTFIWFFRILIIYTIVWITFKKSSVLGIFIGGVVLLPAAIIIHFIKPELSLFHEIKLNFINIFLVFDLSCILICIITLILRKVFRIKEYNLRLKTYGNVFNNSSDYEMLQECNEVKSNFYLKRKEYSKAYLPLVRNIEYSKLEKNLNKEFSALKRVIGFLFNNNVSSPGKAFKYIQEYEHKSVQINNGYTLSYSYFCRGYAFDLMEKYTEAIENYKYGLKELAELKKKNIIIIRSLFLVDVLQKLEYYDESLSILEKCKVLSKEIDVTEHLTLIYERELYIYSVKSEYTKTIEIIEELIKLYTEKKEYDKVSYLYIDISYSLLMTGQLLDYIIEKLKIAEELGFNDEPYLMRYFSKESITENERFKNIREKIINNKFV